MAIKVSNGWKKVRTILLFLLCVLVLGFLWYRGGWDAALRAQGLKSSEMTVLYAVRDSAGTEIRLLTDYGRTDDPVLVKMIRERFGFWKAMEPQKQAHVTGEYVGSKSFPPVSPMTLEEEYHLYYCGSDAAAKIETLSDVLPGGVAAGISQVGKAYLLHFVSYGEDSLLTFDPGELLRQKGYVSE